MAAGKGKRFGADIKNKTAELFNGKPMVKYGVELFAKTTDKIFVVVGVAADSVKSAIGQNDKVEYVFQPEPLGTGNAFKVAMDRVIECGLNPKAVFVGYGDHMMYYDKKILNEMNDVVGEGAKVVLVSTVFDESNKLAWGRIIRSDKAVVGIVEQKDATEEQRRIKEVNAGFYCFDFQFAKDNYNKLEKSPVTGEYYVTDLIKAAAVTGFRIEAVQVPFENVGIGINTKEELQESERLYKQTVGV